MATLYYIHDPMCSWCWGFRNTWQQVQQNLPAAIGLKCLLGGLAPDTDEPMPRSMQASIRETWQHIQQEIPGTRFNFDFWENCQPRRSTWPSCRAVIAARLQDPEKEHEMILAIQQAYYLEGLNPSDESVLIRLARDIGLDSNRLQNDLGVSGFPSLVMDIADEEPHQVEIDYNDPERIIAQINSYRISAE